MRIGLVVYGELSTISGGYLYDRQLKAWLENAGDEVHVFSLPVRGDVRCLLDNFSAPLLDRIVAARLDVLLQDELCHPSLVLLNRRMHGRIHSRMLGQEYGRGWPPVVAIVHHLRGREPGRAGGGRWLLQSIETAYLRSVDGFIFNSGHTRSEVLRLITEPRPSVVAWPAGNRLGSLEPDGITARCGQDGPLRLLALGGAIPRKGLLPLLAALGSVPAGEWQLTVAGRLDADPAHARRVMQAAEVWPPGQVTFAGCLPEEEMAGLLASHQILALPFSYEGFGIVYAEAMAFGLPCLGSTMGGASEIIRHGETGFLVRPGDLEGLAAHVAALANDRGLLLRLSLAASRSFASLPTWTECGQAAHTFLANFTGFSPARPAPF